MVLGVDAKLSHIEKADDPLTLAGLPPGYDALTLGALAKRSPNRGVTLIMRDDTRLREMEDAIRFFHPDIDLLTYPAWDCLPYDRVSPASDLVSNRLSALSGLLGNKSKPTILLTTVNAALQRVVPKSYLKERALTLKPGSDMAMEKLISFLSANGYHRTDQVTEPGDFAVRGGLLDFWSPKTENPVRLDFFGDEIDSIRSFDPVDQRTIQKEWSLSLLAGSEYALDDASIKRFRRAYTGEFGPALPTDGLYAAISEGRIFQGAEHWLPFFHEDLATLFDYTTDHITIMDHQVKEAASERQTLVADYYEARHEALEAAKAQKQSATLELPYKPIPIDSLFLSETELNSLLLEHTVHQMTPFDTPDGKSIDLGGRYGRSFAVERSDKSINIYDAVTQHVRDTRAKDKRVVFASATKGSANRLVGLLGDHGLSGVVEEEHWQDVQHSHKGVVTSLALPLSRGFETDDLIVISEQDVLGDRLVRKSRKTKRADDFLRDATALAVGDLVVHANHGIGRFEGLETLAVSGAPHDCLRLTYANNDKLFIPVENIEVLTRFGSDDGDGALDKLGGVAWQARKAKLKKRIREMADGLMKIAAARELKQGERIDIPSGAFDEFCARFPYVETDDQLRAIEDVMKDFGSGRPMDRLVCGDVGFGKTEVALRAAFLAVMAGFQVAIVAPTTLLARQHYATFTERFRGLPVRIGQLSRLVKPKDAKQSKEELAAGTLDIVIGTHALLAKSIAFKHLGLLIVDEEQHFGVAHKEQLKNLKADVHVLTLTATPIPRTLQMAMNGIRDLSIIASPPVDRLAVRTFVVPFDGMILREALLREHYRGGQSFFVVPRIADLAEAAKFLEEQVPEVKYIVGHGQMPPSTLEDVMTAFYEGQYDVLLSTTIIESGIDIPRANTLVVYRADRFGLAQLYQIRGRVGRSKIRAYAYLTTPSGRTLTDTANRRLDVLQQLDTLGAGFSIASHDLDIRGAGNLIGDAQSGHIKEVGVELYQQMLEDAVRAARAGGLDDEDEDQGWSPQINVGATVMIPESYIPDLPQRLALYRRIGSLETRADVDEFCAELIDRFGPLPGQVKQLAAVIIIKGYAKTAGIEKIDAGNKGLVLTFRNNSFANPEGLIAFISGTGANAKLRPDHTLFYGARMTNAVQRLKTVNAVTKKLASIAAK